MIRASWPWTMRGSWRPAGRSPAAPFGPSAPRVGWLRWRRTTKGCGVAVASRHLSLYDDGARPGLMGSKGITCEGLPTGRTDLIKDGVLVGCLSNWYETQRLLRDPALAEKLGARGPAAEAALTPRNGFRFGSGGGRQFDSAPGVAASNVVLQGDGTVALDALMRRGGD